MRKVDKSKSGVPLKLTTKECGVKINHSINNIGKHKYSTAFYRDKSVISELESLYNSKCAFCESDPSAGSALQVEHYRPKDKLKDDPTHKGYYWLGYEWSNLIYACAKCNRIKSNHFPLNKSGVRVYFHPKDSKSNPDFPKFNINDRDLFGECPLLINPEIVEPSKHIFFAVSGKVYPINNSEEGKESIKRYGLNREPLVLARKKIKDQLLNKCIKWVDEYNAGRISKYQFCLFVEDRLYDLLKIYIDNEPYSIYSITILRFFESFIVDSFSLKSDKDNLLYAYNLFKSKTSRLLM